jgi:hypothetical protein
MKQTIYFTYDELCDICTFMSAFDAKNVIVEVDSRSGIGSVTTAKITNQSINGYKVDVSRVITDESSW